MYVINHSINVIRRPAQQRPPTRSRHSTVRASVSFEPEVRPPPPPPPPPPPQATGRRGILSYLGFAGIAAAGGLGGFTLGRQQPAASGITAAEQKDIDSLRLEAKFKREYDGHVWVQARDGSWVEVRLDAQIPGTVLLRDQQGYIYFITLNIQQIDLTDDYVVTAIFGDGTWERQMQRVQGKDDTGVLVDARMDQESFRDMVSVMQ